MQDIERQKLLEAAAYFVSNTKYCGLVKLFKLLYYTDMLHFREAGRGVTGLDYKALPYGPVPTELYREVQNPKDDMRGVLTIEAPPKGDVSEDSPKGTRIGVVKNPGTADLTRRELRIIHELVEVFRDVTAEQISDISHSRNGPWDIAKRAGQGKWGQLIDFMDSVNLKIGTGEAKSKEELEERAADFAEVRERFG
ncbi:MAG: SocA family protein [Xanthomonadales bacterium]|uniref:Panacea domain-containing protein n=1 Tax=Dokdonella sp. TaxID=2291710 RepID=UPI0031C6A875|nr:SocA family protein [Xanthomonadales bacterium]